MSIDTVAIEWECRRKMQEDQMRFERLKARQRHTEAGLNMAMDLCIAQVTAPWQALADQIRSEMEYKA